MRHLFYLHCMLYPELRRCCSGVKMGPIWACLNTRLLGGAGSMILILKTRYHLCLGPIGFKILAHPSDLLLNQMKGYGNRPPYRFITKSRHLEDMGLVFLCYSDLSVYSVFLFIIYTHTSCSCPLLIFSSLELTLKKMNTEDLGQDKTMRNISSSIVFITKGGSRSPSRTIIITRNHKN